MRTKILSVCLGALVVSCAPNPSAIYIEQLVGLEDVCVLPDDGFSPNGTLDVAPGNPQFFIGVRLVGANNISQRPITAAGRTLELANRDRPLVRNLNVTYRFAKSIGVSAKPYSTAFALSFGDDGAASGPVQLISPELGQALFDALSPSDSLEDSVDLFVDIEFTGVMSGTGGTWTTGKTTYPLKVFRSTGATCPRSVLANTCRYLGQADTQLARPTYVCPP